MRASDVTPRQVDWLWHPFLPLGKISAVAGQMGQAKSLFTVWLAAEVTLGRLDLDGKPGSVIVLGAEDDPEDTTRPRLEAAGADLDRVWVEPAVKLDMKELEAICDELGNVKLITVDPVQAYLPAGVNSWKGQDVRRALEPLRQLAAARQLSALLVQHLNRRGDATDSLARIADSQGIPQLARSVLVWGPDPADPEGDQGAQKALTRAKGNLARSTESATFTIAETMVTAGIKAPKLTRGENKRITADDVVADHETRSAISEAEGWLRATLANGPVPSKDIWKQAHEARLAERTVKRAKSNLRVHCEQLRNGHGITGWVWSLQPVTTYDPLGPIDPLGLVPKQANEANKYASRQQSLDTLAEDDCRHAA